MDRIKQINQTLEEYLSDAEQRFISETDLSNFRKRSVAGREHLDRAEVIRDAELAESKPKINKGRILLGGLAVGAAVAALAGTKPTLPAGIGSHMGHEGPNPTNPVQNEQMNLEHAKLTGEPLISNNK
jgi:hypothetical protein